MSKYGLASMLVAGLSLLVVIVARFILGGWLDMLWFPLGLGLISLATLLITEFKTILEFLTMRTTKNGMNMGIIILLMVFVLGSVNFLSVRNDKTWDVTEGKVNSLSNQTVDILKNLDKELNILVFYKGEDVAEKREQVRTVLKFYEAESPKVKVQFYNTFTENLKTQKYVNDLPDKNREALFVFAEFEGKKIRIQQPVFSEEKLTSAIIKATRKGTKKIYFLVNHGEPSLEDNELSGLSNIKVALEDSSFEVSSLELLKGEVPEDAAVIAVVGSQTSLLDSEMKALREYAKAGGRLLIAVDPGQKHNIALLTKSLGIEFKNNFVLSPLSQLIGKSMASVVGVEYSETSEITKKFQGSMTVFDLVSEVIPAPDKSKELIVNELVKTHSSSFFTNDIERVEKGQPERPFVIGVSVEGRLEKPADKTDEADNTTASEFAAIVYGDSDFLTNQGLINGLNRDLALNSFTYLAKEADLVTIRPKQWKGTTILMTHTVQKTIVLAGVSIPLILLCLSGFLWFRRRSL